MGCDSGVKLTFSSFVTALKQHALDPLISDVAFVNGLLEPYVEGEKIKDRNGNALSLDKSRVSRILSGKDDVPHALRNPLPRVGVFERTKGGLEFFIDEYINPSEIREAIGDICTIAVNDASLSTNARNKLLDTADKPMSFFAAAFLETLTVDNRDDQRKVFWKHGPYSLGILAGDLLSFGFSNRSKRKNLVVIPANTSFETHVTRKYECVNTQIVADSTIHGQWLTRMERSGRGAHLEKRIARDLENRYGPPTELSGGKKAYPIGTLAVVETESAVFCLLAIAQFDERNRATSSVDDLRKAIANLLEYYDCEGQGIDMYLPLLGTGRSRAGLGYQASLNLIVKTCMDNRSSILGMVTIVASTEAMKELSVEGIGESDAL